MLTNKQQNYLNSLAEEEASRIIHVQPFDERTVTIAQSIIKELKDVLTDAEIVCMGASALGISGQNDIDIYVLAPLAQHAGHEHKISKVLKVPRIKNKWHFYREGFEVSIYLEDPENIDQKSQIEVFTLLKDNPSLLKEYEALKLSLSGKTYRQYQTGKYEFYNRILNSQG